jgi:hypothetical protein
MPAPSLAPVSLPTGFEAPFCGGSKAAQRGGFEIRLMFVAGAERISNP